MKGLVCLMTGLLYLSFTAYFWLLIWALGVAACVQFLQDFGVYFMLFEYLKSFFMVFGGIILVFAIVNPPATVGGVSIIIGLILGFLYVFVRDLLEKSYKILRYGPPQKRHQGKKKQKDQQRPSENNQWQDGTEYSRSGGQYTYEHAYRAQEEPKQEQSKQEQKQDRQSHDTKPHVDTPSTLEEACAVLGTKPGLDIAAYKRVWKQEALRYHPDKTRELGERLQRYAEEEMKRINKAWEIIKNAA